MTPIVVIEIDCHEHPYDGIDGYLSLLAIHDTYGVTIEDTSRAHPLADWAWWYRVTGPAANVRRFLVGEYGDAETADELLRNAARGTAAYWECEQCGTAWMPNDTAYPVEHAGVTFHLCAACAIAGGLDGTA